MGKSYRPRPKRGQQKDANHFVPLKACMMWGAGFDKKPNEFGVWRGRIQGLNAELHDTSPYAGEILDWIFIVADIVIFIEVKATREVKAPNRQKLTDSQYYRGKLEPGERSFIYNSSALKAIVFDEESFWDIALQLVDYVLSRDSLAEYNESYDVLFFPFSREDEKNAL